MRDPREENTIQHEDYSGAARHRDLRSMAEDNFARNTQTRVEAVVVGKLYLIELEKAEHGVRLGLGKVEKQVQTEDQEGDNWEVLWFFGDSWTKKNPAFNPWKVNGVRQKDTFSIEYFRLEVDKSDLTKKGYQEVDTRPRFKESFALKVMAFARAEGLVDEDDSRQPSECSSEKDGGNSSNSDADDNSITREVLENQHRRQSKRIASCTQSVRNTQGGEAREDVSEEDSASSSAEKELCSDDEAPNAQNAASSSIMQNKSRNKKTKVSA